jgi:3-dehydroquinate dehydratase-2
MTRILVLNGPNLGSLGRREPEIYGTTTLAEIEAMVRQRCDALGLEVRFEQTNDEGRMVDILEDECGRSAGCILNGGALTHTSIALRDAVVGFGAPVVEVHISNIHAREEFRHTSVTAGAARGIIAGLGPHGYVLAVEALARILQTDTATEKTA